MWQTRGAEKNQVLKNQVSKKNVTTEIRCERQDRTGTAARQSVVSPVKMFRPVAVYVRIYQLLTNNSTAHFTLI